MTHSAPVLVEPFFDADSNTISYVVRDPHSSSCAIVDPVLDFDYAAGRTSTESADSIIEFVRSNNLNVEWIIETHAHADHLSSAPYLQDNLGGKIGIGRKITQVQEIFAGVFSEADSLAQDGSQFDHLFEDGETYYVGDTECTALATPGHTPACMSHVMGDAIFVGDTLFMPDGGTARVDFPGGCAHELYQSTRKILSYPGETRLFMCHDYGPGGRDIAWETTVAAQRKNNIHVADAIDEDAFVEMRTTRDATLSMPRLIIPSIQVNIRAGHFPEKNEEGKTFLKVPVNEL